MDTTSNAGAFSRQSFVAQDTLPDLLLPQMSLVAGSIEGDEPSLRVIYVDPTNLNADFVAEGAAFDESGDVLSETVISTDKVGALVVVSNELHRNGTDSGLADGMIRAITHKANQAFLNNASAPTGVLNDTAITDGGYLGTDLDSVYAAVYGVMGTGVQADYILASPDAMVSLSALKTGTGSNQSLVAAPEVAGLPVTVSADLPAKTILVGSRTAVVSAVGDVILAKSEHAAFARDGLAFRVSLRTGWAVQRGDRIVKISTDVDPG